MCETSQDFGFQFIALACLHGHSCTSMFPGRYQHNVTQTQDNFFVLKQDMFRSIFDHRYLQMSYKEVTEIYNEASYSNNKSKELQRNCKEISTV